jgi:hypothetical protein
MDNQTNPDVLLCEYREVQQGLRDLFTAQDRLLHIAALLIGALVSASCVIHDVTVLYLIPSVIFVFAMICIAKAYTAALVATYCIILSRRLRRLRGTENVLMAWEQGPLWKVTASPFGPVMLAVSFAMLPFVGTFIYISWLAYQWRHATAYVHLIEGGLMLAFVIAYSRWNTENRRRKLIAQVDLMSEK